MRTQEKNKKNKKKKKKATSLTGVRFICARSLGKCQMQNANSRAAVCYGLLAFFFVFCVINQSHSRVRDEPVTRDGAV